MDNEEIIKVLSSHMTNERFERLAEIVKHRTRHVCTVLEKPYDGGNINAAMRSSEAFGFQDFHVIEGPRRLRPTGRTSAGAGKWLSVTKWDNTKECIDNLKKNGCKIIATDGSATKSIDDISFKNKTAIVFGSEHAGISDEMKKSADELISLPIVGMVESYNLSVAVALSLYTAFNKIKDAPGIVLSEDEQQELLAEFCKISVPHSSEILDSCL